MGFNKQKKVFTRKPYDKSLYKWQVQTDINDKTQAQKKLAKAGLGSQAPFTCNASAFSVNGEDWTVTHVYELVVIDGVQHRYAYVECGYVE